MKELNPIVCGETTTNRVPSKPQTFDTSRNPHFCRPLCSFGGEVHNCSPSLPLDIFYPHFLYIDPGPSRDCSFCTVRFKNVEMCIQRGMIIVNAIMYVFILPAVDSHSMQLFIVESRGEQVVM